MAVSSNLFHTATNQAFMGNIAWKGGARVVTDGATTNTSTTVTSATANFTKSDVGATIAGTGIPGGATISSITNSTTVVISSAATATGSSLSVTITPVNDAVKMALFTTLPSLTSPLYANLSNEATGTGYTAGGVALSSLTAVETEANSWGTSAAITTAYTAGQVVRPATGNGFLYVCIVAGTSGGSAPTWPTVVGQTVADGSVTWSCLGEAITVFSSAAASWTTVTLSAQYAVIYDASTNDGANIALVNFGAAQSPSAGTLTVTPDSTLGWFYVSPA